MKWIFEQYKDNPQVQIADGYTVLTIVNGECEIDPKDQAAAEFAKSKNGVPAPKPEPTKKVSKSDGN